MADLTNFESRSGLPECKPEQLFNFLSDIRNFERFIPMGNIQRWSASEDSCSFTVSQLGDVIMGIDRKEKFSLVSYKGTAMKSNHFELIVHIDKRANDLASVKVSLNAELNPIMKMVASRPVNQFLEMVISKIENFNCSEVS
ncbi:MAG TPA: hypothetical protein VHO50_05890 [Bacteroidales bacterium]|nr:hypothetical protein [Bacteroidales bacterium]